MEERLGRHGRLELDAGELADPLERVGHLTALGLELRLVGEVLEAAAAAGRIVGARSLHAGSARVDDLERRRLGVGALHVRDAGLDRVARKAPPDEDDEAVQAPDAVATVGERVDLELELLVFPNGRRDALTLPGLERILVS